MSEMQESDAADDACEHLVDLCEDVLGKGPAPGATPAELVDEGCAADARLGLKRARH